MFLDRLKARILQVAEEKYDEIAATPEVTAERQAICKPCEFVFEPTNSCKKCGCFIQAKTRLKNASCPIGKW